MINLRYHIVSLTAVFLALAIGVTLGSTLLDRATVEGLNTQLENLENDINTRDARIDELEAQAAAAEDLREGLDTDGPALVAGALDDTPVTLVVADGVADDVVEGLRSTVETGGGQVQGTVRLTNRFALDDDDEVSDLASALGVEPGSIPAEALRTRALNAMGGEIRLVQLDSSGATDQSTTTTTTAEPGATSTSATTVAPAEPVAMEVLTALQAAGFLEWEPVAESDEGVALAPGTRVLMVGDADDPTAPVFEPLLTRLTRGSTNPALVVVTAPSPPEGEDEPAATLVDTVRASEELRTRVSTVAPVDHFVGWAAAVLALADAGDGVVGHYGTAEGSARLLPSRSNP